MQMILSIIHILTSIALIGFILIQHGKGADAGAAFGSGASATVFGSRGSGSFLTRATAILATIFFITSLGLVYLSTQHVSSKSVVEKNSVTAQIDSATENKNATDLPPNAVTTSVSTPKTTETVQIPIKPLEELPKTK